MLVLTRRKVKKNLPDELLIITDKRTGDTITLCITKSDNEKASIGIDANQNYSIVRNELQGKN